MHGNVTDQEWTIFKEAYRFFEAHCNPPANQEETAADWWIATGDEICALDRKWKDYSLMRELLLAILSYLDDKAKEKTKETAEFELE